MASTGFKHPVDADLHPGRQLSLFSGFERKLCPFGTGFRPCDLHLIECTGPPSAPDLWCCSGAGPEYSPRVYPGGGRGVFGSLFLFKALRCHVAPICPCPSGRFFMRHGTDRDVCNGIRSNTQIFGPPCILTIDRQYSILR